MADRVPPQPTSPLPAHPPPHHDADALLPTGGRLFDEDAFAGPERTAWPAARAAGPFADSIDALGESLPQGFTLRAAWLGDPIDAELTLTAPELADLARTQGLTERTLYRVAATKH